MEFMTNYRFAIPRFCSGAPGVLTQLKLMVNCCSAPTKALYKKLGREENPGGPI